MQQFAVCCTLYVVSYTVDWKVILTKLFSALHYLNCPSPLATVTAWFTFICIHSLFHILFAGIFKPCKTDTVSRISLGHFIRKPEIIWQVIFYRIDQGFLVLQNPGFDRYSCLNHEIGQADEVYTVGQSQVGQGRMTSILVATRPNQSWHQIIYSINRAKTTGNDCRLIEGCASRERKFVCTRIRLLAVNLEKLTKL